MQKFIFLFLLSVASTGIHAQTRSSNPLAQTQWKGTLRLETPTDAILDFSKDSLIVFKAADHSRIETMTYVVKDSLFTLIKTEGQSDCDNKVPGTYKFVIKGNGIDLTLVTDNCDDRSTVLMDTHWIKVSH